MKCINKYHITVLIFTEFLLGEFSKNNTIECFETHFSTKLNLLEKLKFKMSFKLSAYIACSPNICIVI